MKNRQRALSKHSGPRAGSLPWLLLFVMPGIGVKRWVALGTLGVLVFGVGIAFVLSLGVSDPFLRFVRTVTLGNVLSPIWRGTLVSAAGLSIAGLAGWMLYERLAFGARYSRGSRGIIESLASHRMRSGGPNLVAIGGGSGLSSLLRGLKLHTDNLTAVLTPADDGGSTGRLREIFGVPPLGDARQCLIALSDAEPLVERIFSFRFGEGEGLEDHSLGNLLLSGMITSEGGFTEGLDAAHQMLAVRGRVIPSSEEAGIQLQAKTASGKLLRGESMVGKAGERITSIWLTPSSTRANSSAIAALAAADAILIGPGSLYTSILPNLLVPGLGDAIQRARCPKIYICNVATQHLETDQFDACDHLDALIAHGHITPTHFLMNEKMTKVDPAHQQEIIRPAMDLGHRGIEPVVRDLIDESWGTRHDPEKLAAAVLSLLRG